jgi:HEAT repeat protein
MRHVFISYHHDDGDFAENLISRIERVGLETWVDNDHLHAGEDWRTEIDQAIKDAYALIVIMTPEARSSEYVTYEWAFAWGAGVKVIPVLYKDTKLHPRLEALQYLNFTSRTSRPWEVLIDVVTKAANVQIPNFAPVSQSIPVYLKQFIEALDSANAIDRKKAIENLAILDHPVAQQTLIEALQHPLPDVRYHAAIVQARFNNTTSLPTLLEALGGENRSIYYEVIQAEVIQALSKIGVAAVPGLLEALHDKNEDIRSSAAKALGEIGDVAAVPGLLEALHDQDKDVRLNVVTVLGQIGDRTVVPSLLEALHDQEDIVRVRVASVLGEIGDSTAVPGLLKALHDQNAVVRMDVATALGQIGDRMAVLSLLEALHDQDEDVRSSAAKALGQIGDSTAVPALLEQLKGHIFIDNAIKALGQIGDAAAVPGLVEILHSSYSEYDKLATEALLQIGSDAVPKLIEALHYDLLHGTNVTKRSNIVKVLGNFGNNATVPTLLEALHDQNRSVRWNTVQALGKIGDVTAVPGLLEALHDQEYHMRYTAATALGQIGDSTAVPGLLEALHDQNRSVRTSAAEALGQIGDSTAVPGLLEALHDQESIVRTSVAKALVKIGDAAIPELSEALQINDRDTKGIIVSILRQIDTPKALNIIHMAQI